MKNFFLMFRVLQLLIISLSFSFYNLQIFQSHNIYSVDNEVTQQTIQPSETTLSQTETTNLFSTLKFTKSPLHRMTTSSLYSTPQTTTFKPINTYSKETIKQNEIMNWPQFLRNSSCFSKPCIKNFKTSNVLHILLVLSIIYNILSSFVFIFQLYKRRKR